MDGYADKETSPETVGGGAGKRGEVLTELALSQ